ncbi:MAG: Smr/MutS family protein [Halofilum sp. (in: g-proteobacteria)]|nr:Smr/MutS family protein [Halofilum sp. (in: g-proteobacteria)]
MSKLKLDLHPIARDGAAIERELDRVIEQALERRIRRVEIVTGKGTGQLKKRVLKFLERPAIRACYARIDKDPRNSGRLYVYFDHRG